MWVNKFFRALFGKKPKPKSAHPFEKLQERVAYRFTQVDLLKLACTHKSVLCSGKGGETNERLEFLGDAILNCCVTEYLYKQYPDKSEGQLTKIKSLIVSRKILGEVGFAVKLNDALIFGPGEKENGKNKHSIVSNAFEALLGAMYLDGGLLCVKEFLDRVLFPRINEFMTQESNINHKSRILEISQQDGFGIPRYTVVSTSGPEHDKHFTVQVLIAGVNLGQGCGSNKKTAEQDAARCALDIYDKDTITEHLKGATVS